MRGKLVLAGLALALSGTTAMAQQSQAPAQPAVPIENDLYCSGLVTTENVPRSSYVISGVEANYQITFEAGNYVFINRGERQGVKVGDEFMVIRPVVDPMVGAEWTKWQYGILRRMGTVWEDEGRLKVAVVHHDTSVTQIVQECNSIQRGDIIVPFEERFAPQIKSSANFDQFAPPSGKAKAMVIEGKRFQQSAGTNDVVYINLGRDQGVRLGDYFRVFRYTGMQHEVAYSTPRFDFEIEGEWGPTFGLGASAKKWDWSNTPRQVIAEGVVLRASPNASTVLLTFTLREVYLGDYVEIE